MRRGLTWLVAVPLLVAGSQAAHALTYRLVYPGTSIRVHALLVTGHGYLDRLPLVLGAALAIALVALLVAALDASRGRSARALPAWAFAVLAPLAFALQEIIELSLHTGTFAWHQPRRRRSCRGLPPAAVLAARLARRAAPAAGGGPCRPRARLPAACRRTTHPAPSPPVPAGAHCRGRACSPTASKLPFFVGV